MYNLIFGIITGTDNNNNKMFNTIIEQLKYVCKSTLILVLVWYYKLQL